MSPTHSSYSATKSVLMTTYIYWIGPEALMVGWALSASRILSFEFQLVSSPFWGLELSQGFRSSPPSDQDLQHNFSTCTLACESEVVTSYLRAFPCDMVKTGKAICKPSSFNRNCHARDVGFVVQEGALATRLS